MNKDLLLKTFNQHLKDFMDDVLLVFPKEIDIRTSRTFLLGVIKVKKKLPIYNWYHYIYLPYKEEIDKKNYEFYLNKDYTMDVDNQIVNGIEKIKRKIKLLSEDSKNKSLEYVSNLSKLSELYYN